MTFLQVSPENLLVAVNPAKYSVERILYYESKLRQGKKVSHILVVEKTDSLLNRCKRYFQETAHAEYGRLIDSLKSLQSQYLLIQGMYIATATVRCELPLICKNVNYSFASNYHRQRKAIERMTSRLLKRMMINDMFLTVYDLANYSLPD